MTVAAAQDADAVNDAASIAHAVVAASSADEYDAVTIAGVAVTVTDDETAGVTVSETTLTVTEGGSATYTVRLNTQPTSDVVIGVTRTGSPDVTVSPATLTFTSSNWSTAQTVTVSAAQDADAVNDAASIAHAVVAARSADEFDAVTIAGVAVTVTDDADAGAAVSETTLTVTEGGSATYTVRLNTQPTSDVVIGVTRTGSPDVTVSPATLTFTPANWGTAQTVTVAAAQDADAVNDAASIAHAVNASSSANEYDAVTIAGVAVTVTDDDAGVTVSVISVTAPEGGSATYTVVLDVQPTSDVVINVTKSGSSDVTVSPATLTFTPANWSTAKTVTVAAAQDADAANDAASIAHAVVDASSADEYDNVSIAGVAVTVTDDDTAGVSPPDQSPPDQSPPDQSPTFASRTVDDQVYTVGEDVGTVSLPSALRGNGRLRYSLSPDLPEGLRFNSDRTITGTPRAKFPRTRFTYTASDIDGDRVHLRFHITVNETAGVTVSPTDVTVTEGGSATYTVVLDAPPASDVVITVSSDNTDVTVDTDGATSGNQTTLTFSPANWSTAQTVTVAAAQDADAVNDAASIAHAVVDASSADEFDLVTVAGVRVTVTDDDTAGATVSETTLTVAEGGSGSYTVRLNAQPTSDVVISVTRTGSPDVTLDTDTGTSGNQTTLTFTTANWDTAQTVTVRAAQDADAANDAAAIAHAVVAARSADEYDAATIAGVAVTVTDDDTAGATVSETTLTVTEGGSGSYTVRLNTQPTSDVVISVTRTGSPDVTVSPATLTFTSSNWGTAQTVTVAAAQDADAVNDAASIAHAVVDASSADEFDAVTIAGVAVTVTDDDAAGATVSETTLTVDRGRQRLLHGEAEHAAHLRRGDHGEQRQHGRDGVSGHFDFHFQ